jgi:hypothetical protein
MTEKSQNSEMTKERAIEIAQSILEISNNEKYIAEVKIIKETRLDKERHLYFLFETFIQNTKNKRFVLLSEVKYFIENDESEEQLASDLEIRVEELNTFEEWFLFNYLK